MKSQAPIPIYSIERFDRSARPNPGYKVELFDAHRHFTVSYPHRHDFYEILYLTHGSGRNVIDLEEYPIQPGSVFFVSPGQVHDIEVSTDVAGYIFIFTAEFYLLNKPDQNRLLELPFFYPLSQHQPPVLLKDEPETRELVFYFKKPLQKPTKASKTRKKPFAPCWI
ncbi:MAG: hypothetical protein HC842_08620 [Cytophagales bacterium]|nr:hypothetical protein [Cytophagales bacterium]